MKSGSRRWRGLALLVLLLGMPATQAMEIAQLQTRFHDSAYQLTLTATLDAPLLQVQQVLRDYAAYPQLDDSILEARVLRRTADSVELLTRINVCFTFFCRKVSRVEQVQEKPGELLATVIAARSDAERGSTHTQLIGQGAHTQLVYTTQIVPKFWVPALVGRPLMLRRLREATVSMFERIETRAAADRSL